MYAVLEESPSSLWSSPPPVRRTGVNGLSKGLNNDPQVSTVDVSAKDEGMKKVESQRPGISKRGNQRLKDFDGRKNGFVLVSKHNH